MKFRKLRGKELEVIGEISAYSYRPISISEHGTWVIAYKPVIFGVRVIAFRMDQSDTCAVDYCAANQPKFAVELAAVLQTIMEALPEQINSLELYDLLPKWDVRPINRDRCWDKLKDMAARLSGSKTE